VAESTTQTSEHLSGLPSRARRLSFIVRTGYDFEDTILCMWFEFFAILLIYLCVEEGAPLPHSFWVNISTRSGSFQNWYQYAVEISIEAGSFQNPHPRHVKKRSKCSLSQRRKRGWNIRRGARVIGQSYGLPSGPGMKGIFKSIGLLNWEGWNTLARFPLAILRNTWSRFCRL